MYQVHTTEGFIIDSRPYGEAGNVFSIFTRDFGLVRATAQGIRLEKSKLRYHAQEYALGTYALVRGKEYWRLTGAEKIEAIEPTELAAKMALLLKRLLHGEEAYPDIYDMIEAAFIFEQKEKALDINEHKSLETLVVLRVLKSLGYIGDATISNNIFQDQFSKELLARVVERRTALNQIINAALRESHL